MGKKEIWKPVKGYEDLYVVSNLGNVRSLDRIVPMIHPTGKMIDQYIPGRLLKGSLTDDGYVRIGLHRSGKAKYTTAHRLVCIAFHGDPTAEAFQAAHKDGNKLNNCSDNLYWATPKQNTDDKIRHGTTQAREAHPRAKLNSEKAKQIVMLRSAGVKYRVLAEKYGVAISTIASIINGKNWPEATA